MLLSSFRIKMPNIMTDFKKYWQFLPPKDQIYEINFMIDDINKTNRKGENISKKFRIWNELRTLKKEIIFNCKEHLLQIN